MSDVSVIRHRSRKQSPVTAARLEGPPRACSLSFTCLCCAQVTAACSVMSIMRVED